MEIISRRENLKGEIVSRLKSCTTFENSSSSIGPINYFIRGWMRLQSVGLQEGNFRRELHFKQLIPNKYEVLEVPGQLFIVTSKKGSKAYCGSFITFRHNVIELPR